MSLYFESEKKAKTIFIAEKLDLKYLHIQLRFLDSVPFYINDPWVDALDGAGSDQANAGATLVFKKSMVH